MYKGHSTSTSSQSVAEIQSRKSLTEIWVKWREKYRDNSLGVYKLEIYMVEKMTFETWRKSRYWHV